MTHRLSDRAIWLVGRASLHAHRLVQEQMTGSAQRKQHYGILASLADKGPAVQAHLADRLLIDRSDLVTYLDELEAAKQISRRTDPTDRRRKIVAITSRGQATLKRLDTLMYAADDDLLSPLKAEERTELARLLTKLLPSDLAP
jgi:DNA-binding MarR family transcriptional regulator